MTGIVTMLCAASSEEEAAQLASTLVDEALAACVQAVPVSSWFRWNGAVSEASETLLLIKTTRAATAAVEARLRSMHSYELPEIIVLPVEDGLGGYLDWVKSSVSVPESR